MPNAPACAIVIFGASGDLAQRKLIPAIYDLVKEGLCNEHSYVVGFSRTPMTDPEFRAACHKSIANFARSRPIDQVLLAGMESRIHYLSGNYGLPDDYARLDQLLRELDREHGAAPNRLFYLATPPAQSPAILDSVGTLAGCAPQGAFARVIVEKPFGHDLPSARELNQLLHRHFREEQVFRIDHYLGKETVQNLMVMRFANSIFEPIWNYKYIDHVQITVSESLGVEGRGGYYDRAGALRDIVQNHILQLMALVAMEPPVALDALSIRDEKVKVYRAIRPIRPAAVKDFAVRGQYGPGDHDGRHTDGYLREENVAPDSRTETFAAIKLFVDNWRWSGMPFYLRTGKLLKEKLSEVVVRFRSPPLTLFQKQCEAPVYPNDLIIRVQPNEGISWRLNGKVPGGQMSIKPVALDFLYGTTFHRNPPDAYERLIHDAMIGDQTLFIRADEAEAAWAVIDPIEQGWLQCTTPPDLYEPGSWGPQAAMRLIEQDARRWLHSTNRDEEPIIACSL